ncbi:pyridoxal phosphate-dependent aminotransferase, partial [Ruminococcaceae bacterium OttesenSCG-928-L11]|nr:pyridoxal phosphate-dependent aminotransferase [Ruminococcaceae bacterium OttesenSCG-928-L11]
MANSGVRFDFDTVVERKNTNSAKFDMAERSGKPADILPMWVADMDFPVAPCITEALQKRIDHAIYGYGGLMEEYDKAVTGWFSRRFGWEAQPEWLVRTSGVVFSINIAVRAFTREGDGVIIQQPVYYPFQSAVENNNRKLVNSELLFENGRYTMDFADFEKKVVEEQVKLFVLCSPHNPVGRVWTKEELIQIGDICVRHGVLILSDEIHADFTYPGVTHTIFASLKPEFAENTITCTAPSKTFNLAGLQTSNVFIANEKLRETYQKYLQRMGYHGPALMGQTACMAAYESAGDWLDQLQDYLKGNLDFMRDFLREKLPQLKLVEPEGTYLVWLDCSALGLKGEALDKFIVEKAKLWLDDGLMFGPGGEGFQRFNIACPRATLREGLERLH